MEEDTPLCQVKHYNKMKYNNVPIDQVISKVMADLNISEDSQRIDDYIEWASEAIELIGAPVQMDTVSAPEDADKSIKITGYQARIPNDAVNILSVYYSSTSTGPFNKILPTNSVNRNKDNYDKIVTYYYKPGFICVNREDGYIKIVYSKYHTDEAGMMTVPNLMSYIEAIYWYIVMKLTYPKWRIGQVRDQVYYDSKKSWRFFRNKAYGEMMMPTLDELNHNIRHTWNKLIPESNSNLSDFSNIGLQEKVRR